MSCGEAATMERVFPCSLFFSKGGMGYSKFAEKSKPYKKKSSLVNPRVWIDTEEQRASMNYVAEDEWKMSKRGVFFPVGRGKQNSHRRQPALRHDSVGAADGGRPRRGGLRGPCREQSLALRHVAAGYRKGVIRRAPAR